MTAPDPRVGEIEARAQAALFKVESVHHIHETKCLCGFESHVSRDRTKHIMEATLEAADMAYLLAELRKAREALARVEAECRYLDTLADGDRYYAKVIRAAVAAANGDGQ